MQLLYNLLIQPLILVYDILFTLLYGLIEDPVWSIFALSIVINFFVLPLYKKADALQKADQEQVQKMKPMVTHIKKSFSGDERFMILSTYYKTEHYNPIYVLKEAGPLFLQIPFFIAAYQYISAIPILEGASFGSINDLLQPDKLVSIGNNTINILPIIMTAINLVSGIIYSKDGGIRQKIQIYGTALIFLVLLYNSPSGLVLYWTMNNLFSLCKNIYFTHKPKDDSILQIAISVVLLPLISHGYVTARISSKTDVYLAEFILLCIVVNIIIIVIHLKHIQLPLIFSYNVVNNIRTIVPLILIPELALTLLLGYYIPSTVLSASPLEFIDNSTGMLQTELLTYPLLVYAGLFLIWTTVIILSRDGKVRNFQALFLWFILAIALINQFIFSADTGTLYTDLTFDKGLNFSAFTVMFNTVCCILICFVLMFLFFKKPRILLSIGIIVALSLLCPSFINTYSILKVAHNPAESGNTSTVIRPATSVDKPIALSRNGKNVIVMMLDRAIGGYVPYIFDEIPELKDAYRGFVFYPNTISFGTHTNFGSPGLFGGYEYTPYESNKRDTVTLMDKQNEALKLMPKLFHENDYQVTVCDPPCAGYKFIPDLSIYDDIPGIHTYNLNGKYSEKYISQLKQDPKIRQHRNFLMYSIFRTAPLFLKDIIYDNGDYLSINISFKYTNRMIDAYSALYYLSDTTRIDNSSENIFLMYQNETPHNPTILDPPGYFVDNHTKDLSNNYTSRNLDGRTLKIEDEIQWGHYCINVATYKAVAEWLDFLKAEGIYDNTRIILVADHGYYLSQFDDLIHPDGLDVESLNPLLMVKDFYADEPWSICNEFMTNADVPTLAMEGVIKNPVNPFTGNTVNNYMKLNEPMIVTDSNNWQMEVNNGTTFDLDDGHWWSVHDNIFDMDNWELLD